MRINPIILVMSILYFICYTSAVAVYLNNPNLWSCFYLSFLSILLVAVIYFGVESIVYLGFKSVVYFGVKGVKK
jgi:membrane-bound metal-dependent hydrolase YbcI (DUF457 family)